MAGTAIQAGVSRAWYGDLEQSQILAGKIPVHQIRHTDDWGYILRVVWE